VPGPLETEADEPHSWYYTGDQRIAITGGTLCLDAKDPTDTPQVWKCTTGDTRQVWTI
jgi:hypothetical protein